MVGPGDMPNPRPISGLARRCGTICTIEAAGVFSTPPAPEERTMLEDRPYDFSEMRQHLLTAFEASLAAA
jgi:hypothetical protein